MSGLEDAKQLKVNQLEVEIPLSGKVKVLLREMRKAEEALLFQQELMGSCIPKTLAEGQRCVDEANKLRVEISEYLGEDTLRGERVDEETFLTELLTRLKQKFPPLERDPRKQLRVWLSKLNEEEPILKQVVEKGIEELQEIYTEALFDAMRREIALSGELQLIVDRGGQILGIVPHEAVAAE